MKVAARDVAAILKSVPTGTSGVLLFGPDQMRTSLTREDLLKSHLGANAKEEMRLTRMTGAELRSEPAALQDAIKAIGFFPGERAVLVTEATDNLAKLIGDGLAAWSPGDALVVLEAGNLGKASALRKLFEGDGAALAIGIYADAPSRGMVEATLDRAGVVADRDALAMLVDHANRVDPGDFRQIIERLALYRLNEDGPASVDDVAAIAPVTVEADLDDVIHAVAEGAAARVGPELQRLVAQGVAATTLVIMTTRHFRNLHVAAADPDGPDRGITRLRPPLFGPRRDRALRQVRAWGVHRIERALSLLLDTDLALRSSTPRPQVAVLERALIRIAMMCPNRS